LGVVVVVVVVVVVAAAAAAASTLSALGGAGDTAGLGIGDDIGRRNSGVCVPNELTDGLWLAIDKQDGRAHDDGGTELVYVIGQERLIGVDEEEEDGAVDLGDYAVTHWLNDSKRSARRQHLTKGFRLVKVIRFGSVKSELGADTGRGRVG